MNEVMLDLETYSTRGNALIIQIGATVFNRQGSGTMSELLINVDTQGQQGHSCPETEEWWNHQIKMNPSLERGLNSPSPVPIDEALELYSEFCGQHQVERQWGNGSSFDCSIIDNQYDQLGMQKPIRYYNHRDLRTLADLLGETPEDRQLIENTIKGDSHNALVDCQRQVARLQYLIRRGELNQRGY